MPATADTGPTVYRQHRFAVPPGGTAVMLIRHGESEAVVEGVAPPSRDGHDDQGLADVGHEQAERLADRLGATAIDAIFVSPLRRARETARPLADRLGIEPIIVEDLREVHLGAWEGGLFRKLVSDRHETALQMYAAHRWDVIPDAEPDDAFTARVIGALATVVADRPDRRVVVVAHGGVIAKAIAIAAGSDRTFAFLADNASISELVHVDGRWILRRFNDTAHLEPTARFTDGRAEV